MTDVYVIRNQHGHFWGKRKAWVSGAEAKTVMRTKHEDEAVNSLVELSTKDIDLRGDVVAATLSDRGEPMVEASAIPLPDVAQADAAQPEQSLPTEKDAPDAQEQQVQEPETATAEDANLATKKAS